MISCTCASLWSSTITWQPSRLRLIWWNTRAIGRPPRRTIDYHGGARRSANAPSGRLTEGRAEALAKLRRGEGGPVSGDIEQFLARYAPHVRALALRIARVI